MKLLSGAAVVTGGRLVPAATIALSGDRIADIRPGRSPGAGDEVVDLHGHFIVPGFVDVHVHGTDGSDALDSDSPIARIAGMLPRYGVTAFCPTTVACSPEELARVVSDIRAARARPNADAARVLGAHLESNFINPEYRGAQPHGCLRQPPRPPRLSLGSDAAAPADEDGFSSHDLLAAITAGQREIDIVTLAPELPGALDLIADLVAAGRRVSMGHSGATYEEAIAGIDAGARHATHLFNRMPPLHHRHPGLAGAALASDEVVAELICDLHHVHPAMMRLAIDAKPPGSIIAITDGTAGAGLTVGARARLAGRTITVGHDMAHLEDGTVAGSLLTMDAAFRHLVTTLGCSILDAATMCATGPAQALGLADQGVLRAGALADFVVFDGDLRVRETWIGGRQVFHRAGI